MVRRQFFSADAMSLRRELDRVKACLGTLQLASASRPPWVKGFEPGFLFDSSF